ncbi:aldo/keto reductase [Maribellus comscasis]|uniref:Aldo/keto reductase n=1 Tax=Maribellus comscasis TaxID=2681766 RepID=A0A6I6JK48_9BACT|nr:aldo/keto reductase [Maribellus comscasis]QGY42671.1 aldo/keto reductase [Maribellus comscasis]
MSKIRNKKPGMEYRRFGKTEKYLSAVTLGGMRYKHGGREPRNEIPADTLKQATEVVELAMSHGINHIESAWGYGKSENIYGKVLNEELKIPRHTYNLMTKGNPKTAADMRRMVDAQLIALQTDYLDFYGWHGINNEELLQKSCATKGPVEELHKMKEEGIIRHVGFSTHAPLHVITGAIETGLFEFVNLHYYYFDQHNLEAVEKAAANDMGIFIISPNDKGGQLFNAPQKVKNATLPLTPIQWNAKFCLQNKAIHTLSFGMTEASHFEEMKGIFTSPEMWGETEQHIKQRLDSFLADDPFSKFEGFDLMNDPSGINIPAVLRLRKLWKCYDMKEYGKYRYKIFENKGHWFPGVKASKSNVEKVDCSKVPGEIPLKKMLLETHEELYSPEFKLAK